MLITTTNISAQVRTNIKELERAAVASFAKHDSNIKKAFTLARLYHWDTVMTNKGHGISRLVGVDELNHPIYYTTFDNLIAAATTGASELWPNGSNGFSLSGSSNYLKDKLGIWDGGGVLSTHKELKGRIEQKQGWASNTDEGSIHATHVTGTMMATGINPSAKGMCYKLPNIQAYLFNDDVTTITSAAQNLLLSNHSYGAVCGWYMDGNGNWFYEGSEGETSDFKFGYYNDASASYDNIAFNAPYYLIVKASGNNRTSNGPSLGGSYYYYDTYGNRKQTIRVSGISDNDSYKSIGTTGNAKNILTVGAVNGIANGYKSANDVVMTSFSSWGPTDDGRIKPDLVADGVNVLSCSAANDSAYASLSGTSMATPNVTGSLMLLQEFYARLMNGTFMRAATLKGLAIHTAKEAGTDAGPDYRFGWGLLNVAKGAEVIKAAVTSGNAQTSPHLLFENVLNNGHSYSVNVIASGKTPLTATICWTDPAGSVVTTNILNNTNIELVNDLDIRITKNGVTYFPWILNPKFPDAAATKGDNYRDNVEKIEIDSVVPGQVYTITVSHKGTLKDSTQAYSLIISGVGGKAYCTMPSSTSVGASIDSVAFGEIKNIKTSGCGSYNDFTANVATIKPNKAMPISIKLSSCDGLAHYKSINVYIDYNGNGSFTDSGELVAKGFVAGVTNTFTATILPPNNLTVGTNTLLRIIAAETTHTDTLSPCGSQINGETQDYLINILQPDYDISVNGIISPVNGDNPDSKKLLVIQLANNGTYSQENIKLTATIKKGNTVVGSLSGIYPSSISNGATVTYTFQQPIELLPTSEYSITVNAQAPKDELPSNNIFSEQITIATPFYAKANICNGITNMDVINPVSTTNYSWFDKVANAPSIATGSSASFGTAITDSIVYVGSGMVGNVGPSSKGTYSGGYQPIGNNYLNYTSTVPVILQSAKLYTKYPGKVTITAADISNATSSGSYYYSALRSKTIDVYATNPSPVSGAYEGNDASDTGRVFYINMELPAGKHSIIVSASNATLFRTRDLPISNYPFTFSNIFSITGNSASNSYPSDTNFYKSFYYYLYDMKLSTEDCVGDRIPVSVYTSPKPIVSFLNDSLRSSIATGNQWYMDGVAIAGATGSTYKPQNSASNFYTIVTDSYGCQRKSNYFSLQSIIPIVSSNPNRGAFNLNFYVNFATNLTVSLVNSAGNKVFMKTYPSYQGYFSELYNGQNLASGIYILQIQHGNEIEHKKIVIVH